MRGIVTDRDIRNRAAADGRPVSDATLFGQTSLLQQNQKITISNSPVKPPQ
jgi:hypothetical protein